MSGTITLECGNEIKIVKKVDLAIAVEVSITRPRIGEAVQQDANLVASV